MVLTSTPLRRRTPKKNRRIPTIPAGHIDVGPVNVSTVDTRPRRSESGVLTAEPGVSVTGPPPPSPARRLRMVPVVMVGRQHRPELAQVGPSRPAPRGSGSTGQGLCLLHEGPTYPKCTPPSSSSTPPSCIAPRRRREPPERPHPASGASSGSRAWETGPTGVLRRHDIRNSQKS